MIRQVSLLQAAAALLLAACGVLRAEPPAEKTPRPAAKQSVTVEVTVIEVNRTKLRALGFDWDLLARGANPPPDVPDVNNFKFASVKQLEGFLQALRQYDLAKVISEPTLVTLSGRAASLAVGHTKLDVVPIVLESGRISVEHRLELDHAGGVLKSQSAIEVDPGQPVIAGHLRSQQKDAAGKVTETTLLVLVRADTAEKLAAADAKTSATPSTTTPRR